MKRSSFSVLALSIGLACTVLAGGCRGRLDSASPPPGPLPVAVALEPVGEFGAFETLGGQVDQAQINAGLLDFAQVFELGDALSEAEFHGLDGVGAGLSGGRRFARVPESGRFTGPNSTSCSSCHSLGAGNGAGRPNDNVLQDPARLGVLPFNMRNPPHLLGSGAIQVLAEEITERLHALRDQALAQAQTLNADQAVALEAKGVSYGTLTARANGTLDTSAVQGVDADLVVKPFGWKGIFPTLRSFVSGALSAELGMEPVELAGAGVDNDADGVIDEVSVGDVTALTIYLAMQENPTTLLDLEAAGRIAPLPGAQRAAIVRGEALFAQVGCTSCHVPEMTLQDRFFREPSPRAAYRVRTIQTTNTALTVDYAINGEIAYDRPVVADLSRDGDPPRFALTASGGVRVRLFGDLKRHHMGDQLKEPQDEAGLGVSTFLTKELWGVGSTGPWLHDGRAASLHDAILLHGENTPGIEPSEAQASRDAYKALSSEDQRAVAAFIKNLVLFEFPEAEED